MNESIPQDIPQDKHYVYTLAYPDGRVFYVGMGKGDRIHQHEWEVRSKKRVNPHKESVIRKIWSEGGQILKNIVAFFDLREDAVMLEIALIFLMDGLTNMTNGGEGVVGRVVSLETRKKIGMANKGRPSHSKGKPLPEEQKRHLSEVLKGHVVLDETRKKIGEKSKGKTPAMAGKKHTEETRRKLSDAAKGRISPKKGKPGKPHSEEWKRRQSDIMKGQVRSEAHRANLSASLKGRPVSEETRHKISATLKERAKQKRETGL